MCYKQLGSILITAGAVFILSSFFSSVGIRFIIGIVALVCGLLLQK